VDKLEQLAAMPGALTLGGKTYPILPPTPGDMLREALQMKQFAREVGRKDPLAYVAGAAALLSPAAMAAAVAEAVRVGTAPPPDPTGTLVEEQYGLPAGVRWRLYYHVTRSGGALTEAEAAALVTDVNCGRVCVALDDALKLPEDGDPKKEPAPPTGTSG
jgi:hypothetical protein